MAKKKSAFNMSEVIREILTANPQATSKEVYDAVAAKFPKAKINESSFTVAFYTSRKKLGSSAPRKSGRKKTARSTGDLSTLQSAAKFLSEVGGAESALQAIKQVQALQVK